VVEIFQKWRLSAAALAYAERREMTVTHQIEAWEQVMLIAAGNLHE
jgi:hypothetical protein